MRRLFAAVLVLHGLAHAVAGTLGTGPTWFITVAWLVATLAFVGTGMRLAGSRIRWISLHRGVVVGAIASLSLLATFSFVALIPGVLLNLTFVALVLNLPPEPSGAGSPAPSWWTRLGAWVTTSGLAYIAAVIVVHPWFQRMGSTAADRDVSLFGDSLLAPPPFVQTDNVITIQAPADSVWPWLAQLGQDRGGFYSYEWLEDLFGAQVTNANRIHPEWQRLSAGDFVRAVPPDWLGGAFGPNLGWRVTALDPGRAYVLDKWGSFVVRSIDAHSSRLHLRSRYPREAGIASVFLSPVGVFVLQPAHYIMQRGMLRGIRRRAEGL